MFETKRLLTEAQARAALLEEQLAEERRRRESAEAQVRDLSPLRERVHQLEIKNAVLLERLDLTANYLGGPAPRLQGPTSMPEEAEDALFAFRAGTIDKNELEGLLKQSGYDNTEIDFELSDYPHFAGQD